MLFIVDVIASYSGKLSVAGNKLLSEILNLRSWDE